MPAPNVCVISKDFPSIATPISSCNVTGLVEEPMSYAETVLNAASKPVIEKKNVTVHAAVKHLLFCCVRK